MMAANFNQPPPVDERTPAPVDRWLIDGLSCDISHDKRMVEKPS
jgi:hypothetical protein